MTDALATDVRFEALRFAWPDGRPILDGLDLTFEAGRITAVVGPSGSGKSTLLRLAAGLTAPQGGSVDTADGRLAFVFQSPTLLPWRTTRANVALPLDLRGESNPEAVQHALARVGLAEAADKLPKALSGGMRMRVSLARALVTRPTLMLLDEPFSALDAITRVKMHQVFLDLWREARFTTLLVTHDVDEAVLLSDRVIVLRGPPLQTEQDVTIDLPRPRHDHLRHQPEFGVYVERILAALDPEP